MKHMELKEKLLCIQREIKVPKKRQNTFGNFNYRNLDDMLAALKKLEGKYKVLLTFQTEPVLFGTSVYIKATAVLYDAESTQALESTAYAKEPPQPKAKMDESQCTGSAASYAKKYALNGLILLDDSIDPDSNESIDDGKPASAAQVKQIEELAKKHNVSLPELYKKQLVKGIPTGAQAGNILNLFKKHFGDE